MHNRMWWRRAARLDAAQAQARALRVSSHEFQVTVVSQRRSTDELGGRQRFAESEIGISRALRLPGKARLDRDIGAAGIDSAELRLDDARHQAARLLLEDWMAWLRAAEAVQRTSVQLASFDQEQRVLVRRLALGDVAQKEVELLEVERAQAQAATGCAGRFGQCTAGDAKAIFPVCRFPHTPRMWPRLWCYKEPPRHGLPASSRAAMKSARWNQTRGARHVRHVREPTASLTPRWACAAW